MHPYDLMYLFSDLLEHIQAYMGMQTVAGLSCGEADPQGVFNAFTALDLLSV